MVVLQWCGKDHLIANDRVGQHPCVSAQLTRRMALKGYAAGSATLHVPSTLRICNTVQYPSKEYGVRSMYQQEDTHTSQPLEAAYA